MKTSNKKMALLFSSLFAASGCGSSASNPNLDVSGTTGELAASTVGGAVSSTSGDSVAFSEVRGGTAFAKVLRELSPVSEAFAATFGVCPTIGAGVIAGSGSCSLSGSAMTLTFPSGGCVYGGITGPIWVGGTVVTIDGTAANFTCGGTYPVLTQADPSITRTYLGSLTASPSSRTNASGAETVAIDTSAPAATTFASAATAAPTAGTIGYQYSIPAGGGYTRSFVSAGAHNLAISVRLVGYAGSSETGKVDFDHTLSTTDASGNATPLSVTLSGSGSGLIQRVDGTLILQHNLMKMTATSLFTDVEHERACCYPVKGEIKTSFSSGVNAGLSETISFSAATCALATLGQVSYTDVSGNVGTKTLTHCF